MRLGFHGWITLSPDLGYIQASHPHFQLLLEKTHNKCNNSPRAGLHMTRWFIGTKIYVLMANTFPFFLFLETPAMLRTLAPSYSLCAALAKSSQQLRDRSYKAVAENVGATAAGY